VSAICKRVGLVAIIFDLLVGVGVGSAAVLHRHSGGGGANAARMSAAALEQTVERSAGARGVHASCTADPAAGWDFYCVSSDGSRALYDVSAGRITQRTDLPSYR
jgi:hypothetical protein